MKGDFTRTFNDGSILSLWFKISECMPISYANFFTPTLSPRVRFSSMEYSWPLLLLTLLFSAAVAFLFAAASHRRRRLPPGPPSLPYLGNPFLFGKPLSQIGPVVHQLRAAYGPIINLPIGGRSFIFITGHAAAHRALVAAGAAFADRPPRPLPRPISITSSAYGPVWRLLRRNLVAEVLHPTRIKAYAGARGWSLGLLLGKLAVESEAAGIVKVGACFQFAMFSLFLFMCFGEKMEEEQVREVERVQREVLLRVVQFSTFSFLPRFGEFLFPKRWKENQSILRRQKEVFLPLIRARINKNDCCSSCYVDSLLNLELSGVATAEGSWKLFDEELIILCSEFFNAGIDTTTATFQWVMANLVKHPRIQKTVVDEIESVMSEKGENHRLEEEDLRKMKYLRAVVMETLRLHPPVHFVPPHAAVEEVELEGYVIPKATTVNFAVAEMGRDREVWEEPMEFRPERFLEGEEVDITGTKEIKMMPFGAGRRVCPGIGLALLHLEWFVANLVWEFEWKAKDGEEVDLAETAEAAVVMKTPLEAVIVPRKKKDGFI